MITLWNAVEVAKATGGKARGQWAANAVVIDSRTLAPGALFVALKGERVDGHQYLAQAFDKGAVAAVVSRVPEGFAADDARLVLVDDTEKALQQLGVFARERSAAKFIGVTGSVGKTGCKEMLRTVLSVCGKVFATQGNLNNHLGVPLTLANMPTDTQFAVIEMGMNHAGEIRVLSRWVRPDVSIITTVEAVHLEFFPNVEGIADAKNEIFEGMGGEGVAVINADNPHFERMRTFADAAGVDRILSFGTSAKALCKMTQYRVEDFHSELEAVIAGTPITYRLGAIGKHWGLMSVAVLGVVDALGADLPKAAAALERFTEPKGRGRIEELRVKGGHLKLVDDSYNASPASMRAAFEKMFLLKQSTKEPCRTVVVLGDMLELGDASRDLHVGLVPSIVNNQVDLVFAAGTFMRELYDALPETLRGDYDLTASGLAPKVIRRLQHRDIVLVKGSHGSRMHEVVEAVEKNVVMESEADAV